MNFVKNYRINCDRSSDGSVALCSVWSLSIVASLLIDAVRSSSVNVSRILLLRKRWMQCSGSEVRCSGSSVECRSIAVSFEPRRRWCEQSALVLSSNRARHDTLDCASEEGRANGQFVDGGKRRSAQVAWPPFLFFSQRNRGRVVPDLFW